MRELTTGEQWTECLAASEKGPLFVFKHSTRCPVSAGALARIEQFLAVAPANTPPFYLVKVIESRPVSTAIAEALKVTHQSPQLILVRNGRAIWNDSHQTIAAERIAKALADLVGAD